MKKNKRWNHIRSGLTVCIVSLVFVLSGCKNGFPKMPETRENQDYPKAQAMIVVATERNRYEKTYTDQIWDVTLENGQTFETYLLDQVQNFLKDLKTMNLLARDQEISLTSAEKRPDPSAVGELFQQPDLRGSGVHGNHGRRCRDHVPAVLYCQ